MPAAIVMASRAESLSSAGSDELLAYVLSDEWCALLAPDYYCAAWLLLAAQQQLQNEALRHHVITNHASWTYVTGSGRVSRQAAPHLVDNACCALQTLALHAHALACTPPVHIAVRGTSACCLPQALKERPA